MKNLLLAASAIALLILWACHLEPESGETKLNIEGDPAWSGYSSIIIEVRDLEGNPIDTLFNGHMDGLSDLENLPMGKYRGGDAIFAILGFKGDTLVFEQTRKFDGANGSAVVETTLAVGAPLTTFKASADTLALWLGGPDTVVRLDVQPAFSQPKLAWTYDKEAIEITARDGAYEIRVKSLRAGKTAISVSPEGQALLVRRIGIEAFADAPVLQSNPSKVFISLGGEVEFSVKSTQAYGEVTLFQWDLDGDGGWDDSLAGHWAGKEVDLPRQKRAYAKAGKYTVRFRARDGEGNYGTCEALVEAGDRRPSVELLPKDTIISIKDEVRFRGEIREPGGRLTGYVWDWYGDGKSKDEATLNDSTASLRVSRTFNDTGVINVVLRATDADGKVGADSVLITVERDAPVVSAGAAITAKSNAPVAFAGAATQKFGTITLYKWDFDGNGTWDDSSATSPAFTHAYALEAEYTARLLARDDDGNETVATRKVTISDVPFVITAMRADTTVSIKDVVGFSATVRNDDGKALIHGWDWSGDGKLDDSSATNKTGFTATADRAFDAPGRYRVLFGVRDAQGKYLADSTIVTVVLDAPKAALGDDVTVLTGDAVAVKLLGSQEYGAIAKRELQVNDTVWIPLSKADTILTMPPVKGLVRIIGRVTDDDGLVGLDTMDITVNYPTDNRLSGIFLSAGTLSPAFNADSLLYTVAYAYNAAAVQVGGAARDGKASVTVNGTLLTGAVTSVAVPLAKVGANSATIVVTAQDTSAKRTYTLNLIKAASPVSTLSKLVPSAGSLSPVFAAATVTYTIAMPDSVDTLRFTPTVTDTQARVTVAGVAVANGALSQKLPMKIGQEKFDIEVTPATGAKTVYSVTVTRKGWLLIGSKAFSGARQGLHAVSAENGSAFVAMVDTAATKSLALWKWDNAAWANIGAGHKETGIEHMALGAGVGAAYVAAIVPSGTSIVRRYIGGKWEPVGKTFSTSYGIMELSVDVDKAGLPYYALHHHYMQHQHFIYKMADSVWTFLPLTGAYDSVYNLKTIVNRGTQQPVVGFTRLAPGGTYQAYIETHNGVSYSKVGNVGWPVANSRIDIIFDSLGVGYFAYLEPATRKIAVKKYAAGVWADLGPATGISEGEASSICVVSSGGNPIIAYRDVKLAAMVVRQWNGTAWARASDTDFNFGDITQVRMASDASGAWIAASDAVTGKVTVFRRPLP